jgi:Zn-dependent protease
VNWSVVALLAYGLAAGQFPAEVPRRPEAEYVVAAIVTAVAYMGSLLAHELAHSLVARRNGVQVEGITLWLLDGMSRLQGAAAHRRELPGRHPGNRCPDRGRRVALRRAA